MWLTSLLQKKNTTVCGNCNDQAVLLIVFLLLKEAVRIYAVYLYICQHVDNKVFLSLINIHGAVGELSKYIMLVLWWAALTIKKDLGGSQLNQFFEGFFFTLCFLFVFVIPVLHVPVFHWLR